MAFQKHFNSVSELFSAEIDRKNLDRFTSRTKSMRFDRHWHGASTWEEAKTILLGGWGEGLRAIKKALTSLSLPQVASIRRKVRWSDTGDEVSMDRVYSGDVDQAWRSTERRTCPPGLVPCSKIMVSIGASASRPSSDFFWRGAAAVLLADALEESGRSVEIVAYYFSRGLSTRGEDALLTVTLKRADEPLELSRLAAMTAHAAAFRVGMFRAAYSCPLQVSSGHGMPVDSQDPPARADELQIVIRNIWTEDQARAFLKTASESI